MEQITGPTPRRSPTHGIWPRCANASPSPFVTVDTEFLRETTYYPLLCVAQIASPDEAFIIDAHGRGDRPCAVLRPPDQRARGEGVSRSAPGHRDLSGTRPKRIPHPVFDTQVAAMVLGYGDSIAYDQLVHRITGEQHRQVEPLHRLGAAAAVAGAGRPTPFPT